MQFGAWDCKQSAIESDANNARLGGRYPDRASIVRFAPRRFGTLAEFGLAVVGGPNFALTALPYFALDRSSSSAEQLEFDRPDEMLNVIEFRQRASRPGGSKRTQQPAALAADISGLCSRIMGLQSKARGEICSAILMLDHAAQHAREIAKRISDPTTRKDFEADVATIEQLLQFARELALTLWAAVNSRSRNWVRLRQLQAAMADLRQRPAVSGFRTEHA